MKRKKADLKSHESIVALAVFHRYGWFMLMFAVMLLTDAAPVCILSASIILIAYAAHTLIGYTLRWKHIYCSFQNANHEPMTPASVKWSEVRPSDVYFLSAFFFASGVALSILFFADIR